jgi:hypothetical protein
MFEQTNFVIQQLQRLKKAMQAPELNAFEPDGKDATDVSGFLITLDSTKTTLVTRTVALNGARGQLDSVVQDAHDNNVSVYAAMRSVYRRDDSSLRAIRRIPKKDQSPRQVLVRAEVTAGVWAALPEMPGTTPPAPFKVGALTQKAFNGVVVGLRAKIETCEGCASESEVAQAGLSSLTTEYGNFVSAAVAQGRAQFAPGTPAREWIETIPLEPSTEAPVRAEITEAVSPAAGAVHLEFQAARATSFTIKSRVASDVEFVTVASYVTAESWDAVGVPAGQHQYIVVGVNSRGEGPVSAVATVTVAAAAAA